MTREPGGRYLIYDAILSLSPLLSPSGKRRLYFLSARDGAESSVNFLFFKTFSLNFASYSFARFIQLEKDRAYLIFFTLSVATIDEIDKISRYFEVRAKYLSFPTCGGEEEIQRCVN